MSEVGITIGGRRYSVHCRDGEEDHLRALGAMVDQKCSDANEALGTLSESRQLLMAALLIADELSESRVALERRELRDSATSIGADTLDAIADRLEELCITLEQQGASA